MDSKKQTPTPLRNHGETVALTEIVSPRNRDPMPINRESGAAEWRLPYCG
jgi:hypothetical protein